MARRFFRKLAPSDHKLRQSRVLAVFGSLLLNRRVVQLNRHSAAFGVACGLAWAWIALPIQTLGAVAMALLWRGNVPLAAAFTWVSNPITWVPCFYFAYRVGLVITGAQPISGVEQELREIMGAGFISGIWQSAVFLGENLLRLYPMYIGGAVLATLNGVAAYVLVQLAWRWNIVRRWRFRHASRVSRLAALLPGKGADTTPRPPLPARLSGGFAHLARSAANVRNVRGQVRQHV